MILKAFLKHEILNLLKSRRVYLTVLLFLVLFASVFVVRVMDYQRQINNYLADVRQADEAMLNPSNYSHINPRAIHQPAIFSIYNQGFLFNRVINIVFYDPITSSVAYNEERNLLFSENNKLDITFLITFFLSLFTLLISYDSVNGEKQTGTLRILLTFPIKRQSFILKKILGIFIFVAIAFTIPYTLSLICLMLIYANLLTSFFFLSAFFYWFLVILFIFFFSLLGILLSVSTVYPSRSLVYCLLTWMLLCIVLPTSWNYIISPKLFDDRIDQLIQIYDDKLAEANTIYNKPPQEINFFSGKFVRISYRQSAEFEISCFQGEYEHFYLFLKYIYDTYYPASREVEHAIDNVIRMRINIEKTKSRVFFFNPIVLFNGISNDISGNSRSDYLEFLNKGRAIRENLVNTGFRDGWLFNYGFLALTADENLLGKREDFDFRNFGKIDTIIADAEPFTFDMPIIMRYDQPNPTFGEIFSRIAVVLTIFVASILALWILTWYRFMKFDVR